MEKREEKEGYLDRSMESMASIGSHIHINSDSLFLFPLFSAIFGLHTPNVPMWQRGSTHLEREKGLWQIRSEERNRFEREGKGGGRKALLLEICSKADKAENVLLRCELLHKRAWRRHEDARNCWEKEEKKKDRAEKSGFISMRKGQL